MPIILNGGSRYTASSEPLRHRGDRALPAQAAAWFKRRDGKVTPSIVRSA